MVEHSSIHGCGIEMNGVEMNGKVRQILLDSQQSYLVHVFLPMTKLHVGILP